MGVKRLLFCLCFVVCSWVQLSAQSISNEKLTIDSILQKRGEIQFSFILPPQISIHYITRIISIDQKQGNQIRAYANRDQFNQFLNLHIDFEIITNSQIQRSFRKTDHAVTGSWYPTYEQYDSLMHKFQSDYPSLCQLTEIGKTVKGRSLYYLKISKDVNFHLNKPVAMYSSSMHGDEIVGYALMLRLMDYLLKGYAIPQIKTLIDSCELWICPLANPDGTYFGGNQTVFESKRFNANNIDLNRNFPDPSDGSHPDNNEWQPENIAQMNFIKQHPLVLSANFHSGSEVVNYPWDTWEKPHPDDSWYQYISHQYADTVHRYSSPYFFTNIDPSGIIKGYDWYSITGGRQDYVNYFMHGREVTIELEMDKIAPESDLDMYWNDHYRSLLQYLSESNYGIQGQITDKATGLPVNAKIEIPGHDFDNSYVYSDSSTGMFFRMLIPGTYDLQISSPGYISQKLTDIVLEAKSKTRVDIMLQTLDKKSAGNDLRVFPIPAYDHLTLNSDYFDGGKVEIVVSDLLGRTVKILDYESAVKEIQVDVDDLGASTYFLNIRSGLFNKTVKFIKVK